MTPYNPPRPAPPHVGRPCRCHPASQGHYYDPETHDLEMLRCTHPGCSRTWEQERIKPTRCPGQVLYLWRDAHVAPEIARVAGVSLETVRLELGRKWWRSGARVVPGPSV